MANKKGFKAVSLESLDDDHLEEMVLSNWHKLNAALKAGQSIDTLRRLLYIELKKCACARPVIAERIRSSLSRAIAQRSRNALVNALEVLSQPEANIGSAEELDNWLIEAGLIAFHADMVADAFEESV